MCDSCLLQPFRFNQREDIMIINSLLILLGVGMVLFRQNATYNQILRNQHKIMASQSEEAAVLTAMKDQLTKASGEIVAKIDELTQAVENAGSTTPEVDLATEELRTLAQSLDDIVADQA